MKARRVKRLDPRGALADNAERIVATRLDELLRFMPQAADPAEVAALHDLRIAAKRLRYVLELTHGCFGSFAKGAIKPLKRLQDALGEIHDLDVAAPDVAALRAELEAADARHLAAAAQAAGRVDLDLAEAEAAPHRAEHAGLAALQVGMAARRAVLHSTFLAAWRELERDGYRSRLRHAIRERAD